jgi:hypothetical protein
MSLRLSFHRVFNLYLLNKILNNNQWGKSQVSLAHLPRIFKELSKQLKTANNRIEADVANNRHAAHALRNKGTLFTY